MAIRNSNFDPTDYTKEALEGKSGAWHLSTDPSHIWEPGRSNNFELLIPGLDEYIDNADELIRLSVKSTSVPHYQQSAIEIKRGNSTIKFAGEPSFGSGSIKIYDFIDPDTKHILQEWQRRSYDPVTEKIGFADEYKRTCYLKEFTPNYEEVVREWVVYGCWISNISEQDFDADSRDKRVIDVTIEYDRAVLQ